MDDHNEHEQPEAEGSMFYAPPPDPSLSDRRKAADPNFSGPERREANRRQPSERRAASQEYELKSRSESIYPEAFIPVSKEFYEGLTKEQQDKLIKIQAIAQEKVGYEKGAPKFFIGDFIPGESTVPSRKSQAADPVSDAAPRLVVGGALIGAGLLATGLSLAHVLPGGMVLVGALLGLGIGIALAINPRG